MTPLDCAVALLSVGAGFLTAAIGFGGAIFLMLFFPMLFPFLQASALSSAIVYAGIVVLTWEYRAHIRWKKLVIPVVCYVASGVATIAHVDRINGVYLKLAFGVFLVLLGIYNFICADRLRVKENFITAAVCSTLSGAGTGLFGIGGPPMAMYLLAVTEGDKDAYIGTTQAFFALSMIFTIWARIANGILGPSLFRYVLVGTACSLLGKRVGTDMQAHINIGLMKRCVCGFMIASGVTTIAGSVV